MKVSIIIPVYNVEKYIDECIETAINQTIDSFEVIAVNDGSMDSSLEKLMKYAEKYDFVKIVDQANKGVSVARNSGLNEAKGEYVYFLDSDDYITLDSMEYCYNIAKKDNLDIVLFDAKSFVDSSYTGKKLIENYDRSKKLESIIMSGSEFFNYASEKGGYETPVWLNFYNREFLIKNKLYFYEGIVHEDEIHTLKAITSAKKVMYIPKQFFNRRVRESSIMTSKIGYKNAYGMKIVAKDGYDFYMSNKEKFNDKTNEKIKEKIRFFYWASFRYCDKMQEDNSVKDKLRYEIITQLNNTNDIITEKLKKQIYNPKKYYKIEDIKMKFKGIIKTSKYSHVFRKVLLCLKKK